jgi:hypothetical protein
MRIPSGSVDAREEAKLAAEIAGLAAASHSHSICAMTGPVAGSLDSEPCDMMVQPYLRSVESHGELSVIVIDGVVTHAINKLPKHGDFRCQPEWGADITVATLTSAELAFVYDVLKKAQKCVERFEMPFATGIGPDDIAMGPRPLRSDGLIFARLDFLRLVPSAFDSIVAAPTPTPEVQSHAVLTRSEAGAGGSPVAKIHPDSTPLLLLELELIDPVLYFDLAPASAAGSKNDVASDALAAAVERRYIVALNVRSSSSNGILQQNF